MTRPQRHLETVTEFWEDVVDDMEATAAEYRDDGWEVLELHPGDVTPRRPVDADDLWGLDVLTPDDEFAEVERMVVEAGAEFDSCEVFRASGGGMVFAVVAMLEEERREAVVFPVYYHPQDASEMLSRALEVGEMRTHVRPLDERLVVTFTQGDPELFAPE